MTQEQPDKRQRSFNLPADLLDALDERAERNLRSANKELQLILEKELVDRAESTDPGA